MPIDILPPDDGALLTWIDLALGSFAGGLHLARVPAERSYSGSSVFAGGVMECLLTTR
jgi:hypothetical protein